MDSHWIFPNKIKQEEPLEFFLISSTTDEELKAFEKNSNNEREIAFIEVKEEVFEDIEPDNVEYIKNEFVKETNSNAEHLEEISFIEVKKEVVQHIQPDKSVEHPENIKNEFVKKRSEYEHDSEYEPDSAYEPDSEYDPESEYKVSSDKKKKKTKPQKKPNSSFHNISTVEDITCKGPPYTCKLCLLQFPIKKSLKAHQSIHKGKTVQCDICKGWYRNKTLIYEHMKIHFEKQFSCPICSKTFALQKSFLNHQLTHEERKFECDYCSKRFRQKGHISEHMKVHRERTKNFKCQVCDLAFYEQRTLNRHMKYIHSTAQRKRYRCPNTLCDKFYSSVGAFRMHACVDGRRPQNYLKVICTLCDKRFYDKSEFERHMRAAHVKKPDKHECTKCQKKFLHRDYRAYVRHVGQGCTRPAYKCDYCSKTIANKSKFIEHFVKRHHIAGIANTQSCPHCVKVFTSQLMLDSHLQKNHIQSKCNHCNKTYRSKKGLNMHRRHLRESMLKKTFEYFECYICKLTFRSKELVRRHFRVGDHRTTLECEFCQRKFKQISASKTHMIYCKLKPKKGLQV